MTIEQLAIVIKDSNGKCKQVALTKQQSLIITNILPSLFDGGAVKVLPTELDLTLDPYKS